MICHKVYEFLMSILKLSNIRPSQLIYKHENKFSKQSDMI
jgi:hypothetical protein